MTQQQKPPDHPVDVLLPMLVQTAKVFRDPSKHNSKNLVHTNAQMKQVVPVAMDRFHSSLDELEVEILRAKATLLRDLAASRARRAERERLSREAKKKALTTAAVQSSEGPMEDASRPKSPVTKLEENEPSSNDVIMEEHSASREEENTKAETPQEAKPEVVSEGKEVAALPPLDLSNVGPITLDTEGKKAAVENRADEDKVLSQAPSVNETPATAGLDKMDFESMFPDSAIEGDALDLNFDLDFPIDSSGEPGSLVNDGNVGLATTDVGRTSGTPGAPANDDVNSLLPGLESYANDADSLNLLDLPSANTGGDIAMGDSAATHGLDVDTLSGELGPPESTNFDDLFFDSAGLDLGSGVGNTEGGEENAFGKGGEFDALFDLG
ncbi:MAG: hypothetical protein M1833_006880 [Piccolia ochrophora]|nr:MAG: hypothetical protein M1833_006880 [Piccolia ochrophora]